MIRRDMPDVLAIEQECFEFPWYEEDFIRCLRQRNCIGMVAEQGEKVVGFMIYELHKAKLHILNFAVHPSWRRNGVGAQMVAKLIGKLSKGYRQRVGLAQALLGDPEVLILDEPTIGLDPRQITEIRALIRSLAGQHTVILSTHILPEVSMVCDGVIIINRGRIVAQGTESELVEQVFPTARVELHVAGATGDVAQTLRAVPAVLGVEARPSRDGTQAFIVESPRDRDVRSDLVALVMSRGWALLELHQVGMSLEEVFIRVVAGEETQEQAVVAAPEAVAPDDAVAPESD
jgi:ABC-2 type transport system ATP-binding protein